MLKSNRSYDEAIAEFRAAGPSGLHRRIVQVAYLKAIETGMPAWTWLEIVIDRFRTAIATTYGSFAALASYARATAHWGTIDGRPLRDVLADLDPESADFELDVYAATARVNRQEACRARRLSGAGGGRGRQPEAYPVVLMLEGLLVRADAGDAAAQGELREVRRVLDAS